MLIQITVQCGDVKAEFREEVSGSAEQREEAAHRMGQQVGRRIAEQALNEQAADVQSPCCCGRRMEYRDRRSVTVHGLDGSLRIERKRYRCCVCQRTLYPTDALQQCGSHRVTRPLAKRVCQLATIEHFTQMPQLLFDQQGVRLSHEEIVELVHDVGTQANRLRLAESQFWRDSGRKTWPQAKVLPQRVYVSCDGIMYCTNQSEPDPQHPGQKRLIWQQMKVGCVYWQDEQERWHKRVVWGRESPEEFGASLYRMACECGYREAAEKIFAADGADWCWDIHLRYFNEATGILDWYHASEHVWTTAKILHPDQPEARALFVDQALSRMREKGGMGLADWLEQQRQGTRGQKRESLDQLIRYVRLREQFMEYASYRKRGWQIGTGMMESTCKQLVGQRLKGPGMHWSEVGALAVTALRAQTLNENWHPFWNTLVMNA